MTGDWLAPDALIVPVDYATYLAAEVAREAALFLVDDRGQFLANRDSRPVRRLPRPDGNARRGDPRRHAAAGDRSCGRDASRGRAGGRRLRAPRSSGARRPSAWERSSRADAAPRRPSSTRAPAQRRMPSARHTSGRSSPSPTTRRSPCASSSGPLAWCSWWCWSRSSRSPASSSGSRPGPSRRRAGRPRSRVSPRTSPSSVMRPASLTSPPTSTHDLFVAQGYVHASERMWQMEVWRHISAGRLAEVFGPGQLDTDKFIRTLGWRVAAQRDLDAVGPEARAVLDAYTEGVNVWLDGHRGSLGLAFLVAGVTPEPWTNLDTVAWGKVQAWNLGGNFDSEVFRYLADAALGDPARTDELFPPYREDAPVITPTGLPGSGGAGANGIAARDRDATDPSRHSPPDRPGRGGRLALDRRSRPGAPPDRRSRRRRRPRLGPWHRFEQLGGRPGDVADRRRPARQRPAPRHLDAVDLVHQRPPLPDRHARLSVRRRGRLVPGRAGRRPRPQRPHRVGRDEHRPRRPGPRHRDRRPGEPGRLPPRRGVDPVRDPPRADQGGRRGAVRPGDPLDGPRADPQRRR